jgi:hypothetical protein
LENPSVEISLSTHPCIEPHARKAFAINFRCAAFIIAQFFRHQIQSVYVLGHRVELAAKVRNPKRAHRCFIDSQ